MPEIGSKEVAPMAVLEAEIARYESMRTELERDHDGEWAVIHNGDLVGTYQTFDDASAEAVKRFGRGPYLIRQIGAPPRQIPASLQYRRRYEYG